MQNERLSLLENVKKNYDGREMIVNALENEVTPSFRHKYKCQI